MFIKKKYIYGLGFIFIIGVSFTLLFLTSKPSSYQYSKNEFINWTNGKLRKNNWVSYDKRAFVSHDPFQKEENIVFWVINSNSSHLMVAQSIGTTTHEGLPAREISDLFIYGSQDWILFPFTIMIPKAIKAINENEHMTVLVNEKRWDTVYFKFKNRTENKTKIYTWVLDEDTHVAEKIKVTTTYPTKPKRGYIMEMKESSFFIGDEVILILSYLGILSPIVGIIMGIYLLYQKRKTKTVEKERQHLQSEEYRQQFMEQYEKDKSKN